MVLIMTIKDNIKLIGCGRTGTFYALYLVICEDAISAKAVENFYNIGRRGLESRKQEVLIEIVSTLKEARFKSHAIIELMKNRRFSQKK